MSILDFVFYTTNNVLSYRFRDVVSTGEQILSYSFTHGKQTCIRTTYIILDTPYNSAFGHWLYESAILIPYLPIIAKKYTNIKLVYNNASSYKDAVLDYFGIGREYRYTPKIVKYGKNASELEYFFDNDENICIYPNLHICSLNPETFSNEYSKFIMPLFKCFDFKCEKEFRVTLFPRHNKQNFWISDRRIHTNDIAEHLTEQDLVVDTSKCRNLAEQVSFVQRSKYIVIPDGSAFLGNGLFARDSIFVILCGFILTCSQAVTDTFKLKQIINQIRKNNVIIYALIPAANPENQTFLYEHVKPVIEDDCATIKMGHNIFMYSPYDISKVYRHKLQDLLDAWKD